MKRYITLITLALMSISTLMSQDWKIVIYADDKPAMEYKTSEIDSIVFEEYMPMTIEAADGWYVYGEGTSSPTISSLGILKPALLESTGTAREGMMETYIAVEKGGLLHIGMIKDKVLTSYGPDFNFDPELFMEQYPEEPQKTLLRGKLAESNVPFMINESGLYHIVYDVQLNTYIIAKAEWGIIGSASPEGWSKSVDMPAMFDNDTMIFEVENIELSKGEFKFRYSNGWKVHLYYEENWENRVAAYTNFGGSVEELLSGNNNILHEENAIYTVSLTWILGQGFSADLEKTEDIIPNDWSQTPWDIVGNGVSSMNEEAEADTIWQWGKYILADNYGLPMFNDTVYTYQWTDIKLVANEGFKVRDLRSVNAFGYNVLDITISSDKVIKEAGNDNLQVTSNAQYTILLQVFPFNNDSISLTIVESEIPPISNDWYLWVQGTTHNVMNSDIKLQPATNEFSASELLDIYMSIDSGGSFYLANNNTNLELYGPSNDFAMVSPESLVSSEPVGGLYKGSLMKDALFTVSSSGLYHIVLDPITLKCTLAKTEWGIIGDATPTGWIASTQMMETYYPDSVIFTLQDVSLSGGKEMKFRYNNGWRVYLQYNDDTTDIATFTNLGGDIEMLIPGGDNLLIDSSGQYDITLAWHYGEGFEASLMKIEEAPLKDWSNAKWEAVGTAINDDNMTAYADTLWTWGNRLWADNNGIPQSSNGVYTYLWDDVILNSDKGFKLRHIVDNDSIAMDIGAYYFNQSLSSQKIIIDDVNLVPTVDGVFDINLTIDANNDNNISIVVTENMSDTTTIPTITDGWYVYGSATPIDSISGIGMLIPTMNELTGAVDFNLIETYISLNSTGDFHLLNVESGIQTLYGPSDNYTLTPENERPSGEPQGLQYRGSAIPDSSTFSVQDDALYHIVYHTTTGQIFVGKAEWGIIGDATEIGWSESTTLSSMFNPNKIEFIGEDITLYGDKDVKFRYSNGWSTILQPNSSEDVNDGAAAYTNFGGSFDQLITGGQNINVDSSGIYDVSLVWELGMGFSSTITKTGDLQYKDWSAITWDVVGSGVSADNSSEEADPIWSWGMRQWADGDGTPAVSNDIYTYTWNVILEANEGFKLRQVEDGVYLYDIGYSGIDLSNSTNLLLDDNNNIQVSTKGTYIITLSIDAANNDAKTVTILEGI